jgi:hypothetical protein
MTLERIHLFVLSLVVRLIGILFLYYAAQNIEGAFDGIFFPNGQVSTTYILANISDLALKLALSAYFLLGAPPVLRWVQRIPPSR